MSAFYPFMTVMAQPAYEIGSNVAQLPFSRLEDPDLPPRHVVLPARLIRRHSCGRHLRNGTHWPHRDCAQPVLCLPIPRDAQMRGILIKSLSEEERRAGYECLGLSDVASECPGAPQRTRRPPGYDKPDVTRLLRVLRRQEAGRVPHLDLWVTSQPVYEYVLGRELRYPVQTTRLEGPGLRVSPEDHVDAERLSGWAKTPWRAISPGDLTMSSRAPPTAASTM